MDDTATRPVDASPAAPTADAPDATDGAPTDGAPTDGAPTDGAPTDGAPTDGRPHRSGAVERAHWAGVADRMLLAVRPYASPGHAQVVLPGAPGGYGRAVDGLEGFARTLLIAGFRLAGDLGADPHDLADWFARGIAHGVDPTSPERWVRLDEHPQAKVEAASLALVLDLTRPWLWDRLDETVRQQVVDYLAPAVGDDSYPRINWVWFRTVVQTFLRSVGGPWSRADVEADLATHDGFVRADGWLSDSVEQRAFDHYTGWALHTYPVLWARMQGAADLAAGRRDRDVALLDRFLLDALALVGGDGSPLVQGRSLTYRFAAAAPFWAGALAGVPSTGAGALRHAATSVLRHFERHGVPDERGLLTIGWHGEWRPLAQRYSGPGSPYWAAKGLLGLALPADHPVWTAPAEPLPVEVGDRLTAVAAPGWLVSATRADGIVRVHNHGTDHERPGVPAADSPLYARLGYSTATSPLLDRASWTDPIDQAVVVLDGDARATHRSGMRLLALEIDRTGPEPVGVAASTGPVHWLTPGPPRPDHGSGLTGGLEPAGTVTVVSLVRGRWEVRLARFEPADAAAARGVALRVGGWPVAGPDVVRSASPDGATAVAGGVRSRVAAGAGSTRTGVEHRNGASPLGPAAAVPWVQFPARSDRWAVALLELGAAGPGPDPLDGPPDVAVSAAGDEPGVTVTTRWPDGRRTVTRLPSPVAATVSGTLGPRP